jgi:hypothetical protein
MVFVCDIIVRNANRIVQTDSPVFCTFLPSDCSDREICHGTIVHADQAFVLGQIHISRAIQLRDCYRGARVRAWLREGRGEGKLVSGFRRCEGAGVV